MHVRDDHILNLRRLDPDLAQTISRGNAETFARASLRPLRRSRYRRRKPARAAHGPDEVIHRHGPVVDIAADEILTRHTVVMRVTDRNASHSSGVSAEVRHIGYLIWEGIQMSLARRIVTSTRSLTFEQFPAEVVEKVKICVMDFLSAACESLICPGVDRRSGSPGRGAGVPAIWLSVACTRGRCGLRQRRPRPRACSRRHAHGIGEPPGSRRVSDAYGACLGNTRHRAATSSRQQSAATRSARKSAGR